MSEFFIGFETDEIHDLSKIQNWFQKLKIPQKIKFFCLNIGYLQSLQTKNVNIGTLCTTVLESIPNLDRFKIIFANYENDVYRIFDEILNFTSKNLLLKTIEVVVNYSIKKKDFDDVCNFLQKIKNVPYLSRVELMFIGCAVWIEKWKIPNLLKWKCQYTCSKDQLLFTFTNKDIDDDCDHDNGDDVNRKKQQQSQK